MDVHDKIMLRKRSIIETINDMLKNVAQIVHTRHRSISNYCYPVNFQTAQESFPKPFRIGLRAFIFKYCRVKLLPDSNNIF